MKRFQNKIGFDKDKQYKYVSDDLYKNGIFTDDENEIANNTARKVKPKEDIDTSKTKKKSLQPIIDEQNIDGFKVFVGKNNKQNDYITTKLARPNDIWFHTQKIHGSHVLLKTENKAVPKEVLLQCVKLLRCTFTHTIKGMWPISRFSY